MQGCHHPAHTSLPASVGFLRVKLHLHPAAEDFLTRGDSPKTLQNESWPRVPMNSFCVCVCVSCVCSGLTKQDFCLFTSPVCFKCLWGLVWLLFGWGSCFLWFRLQLQKNTANQAASTTRACVTGTSTMCTHMFSFEVFRWKLWKPALEVQRQMWLHSWMEAFHLETQNSAAPWWLKEELQLRAQWIHPLSSLPVIIIGWIARCRLMVSWPISSKHYHIEDENKFCSGAVNLLSVKCDLVFSTTYLLLIIILTPLSCVK